MQVRKNIASFLLSVVTAVMLVIAVYPHHHHRDEMCFAQEHCAGDRMGDGKEEQAEHHTHDQQDQQHGCLAGSVYILPDLKPDQDIPVITSWQSFDPGVYTDDLRLRDVPAKNLAANRAYLPALPAGRPLSGADGLRAPPAS